MEVTNKESSQAFIPHFPGSGDFKSFYMQVLKYRLVFKKTGFCEVFHARGAQIHDADVATSW